MVAERAAKAGATVWDGTEAVEPLVEAGLVRGARVKAKPGGDEQPETPAQRPAGRPGTGRGPGPLHGGRRRGQLPLRPVARHQPQPGLPAGHGHPGLLDVAPPRRALDRQLARHPRQGRQRAARLRLDLPGRRRPHQRRASGCSPPSTSGRPSTPPTSSRASPSTPRPSWDIRPDTACGPATGGRLPDGPVRRPARRARPGWWSATPAAPSTPSTARASPTPTSRGAWPPMPCTWRSPAGTAWPCRPTSSASTRPTPCTTRWPGPSSGSSAGPS